MRRENNGRDGNKVYNRMRSAILRLELRPGAPLDEAGIAEQLQVSRTPVREAIIQLISDGLVIRDGRIARVAPLDFDDVPRLLDALLTASRLIHRLAAEHRTKQDITDIEKAMAAFEEKRHSGDGLLRSELNMSFHLSISRAAKNRHIEEFYEATLRAQIRLARACFSDDFDDQDPGRSEDDLVSHMDETARQHRKIYEAIRDGDVELVDQLAVQHELLSRQRLQKRLFSLDSALLNFEISPSALQSALR